MSYTITDQESGQKHQGERFGEWVVFDLGNKFPSNFHVEFMTEGHQIFDEVLGEIRSFIVA